MWIKGNEKKPEGKSVKGQQKVNDWVCREKHLARELKAFHKASGRKKVDELNAVIRKKKRQIPFAGPVGEEGGTKRKMDGIQKKPDGKKNWVSDKGETARRAKEGELSLKQKWDNESVVKRGGENGRIMTKKEKRDFYESRKVILRGTLKNQQELEIKTRTRQNKKHNRIKKKKRHLLEGIAEQRLQRIGTELLNLKKTREKGRERQKEQNFRQTDELLFKGGLKNGVETPSRKG